MWKKEEDEQEVEEEGGKSEKKETASYRLHKVKHLPLLDLLHLEDVLQGDLVEMLPHVIHLVVRLQQGGKVNRLIIMRKKTLILTNQM